MSSLPDSAHPAPTNLASSVSLAPLAQSAVFDSPQAGGVGGGSPDSALFTRERQAAFLAGLAASGIVRSAAAAFKALVKAAAGLNLAGKRWAGPLRQPVRLPPPPAGEDLGSAPFRG